MKINHIQADNFLRLNLFDADLEDATVHLFAGNNEAGKSSVQEAIRFALTGETLRVSKKGDYKLMIRDGAKSGSVSVTIDDHTFRRDIKTAKMDDQMGVLPEYLPYLLDAQKFAHAGAAVRRSFLLDLTETSVMPDDIARRMKAKGVHEQCIEKVKPMLRSSMDAAYKESMSRATDLRSQWTGLTGNQRYGSQIAAGWEPVPPEGYDPQALLDGEEDQAKQQARIDILNVKKGGFIASRDNINRELAAAPTGTAEVFDPKQLKKIEKGIKTGEAELEKLAAARDELNHQIFNAKEKSPVTCCECGAMLRVEFVSVPGAGRTAKVEPFRPLTEDETQKLQVEHNAAANEYGEAKGALDVLRSESEDMRRIRDNAASTSLQYSQKDADAVSAELDRINDELTSLALSKQKVDGDVATLVAAANQIRDAEKIKSHAMAMHRGIEAWGKCSDALAPDGIPAEILSDTLKPVNERLRGTSIATGWPQVTIDPTMQIMADGRHYNLLSESSRWRSDAAIADAISHLSGLKMLILDRIDVLDISNRGALMKWVQSIMDGYDTILLFGTLKQLPILPAGMAAHWIDAGELRAET